MIETKEDNRKIYSSIDAKDLIDSSGFTRILIDLIIKCSKMPKKMMFSYVKDNVGILGIDFGECIIIRTYMNLPEHDDTWNKMEVSDIGSHVLMISEADLVFDYDKHNNTITITTNGSIELNESTQVYLRSLACALQDTTISTYSDFRNFLGLKYKKF